MIKKLKGKFAALSIISLFVLLAAAIIGMNVLNYAAFVNETDELLNFITRNEGRFPVLDHNRPDDLPPHFSRETPHERRLFTVLLEKISASIQYEKMLKITVIF